MLYINIGVFILLEFFILDFIFKIRDRIKKHKIDVNYIFKLYLVLFIAWRVSASYFSMNNIIKYFMITTLIYIISLYKYPDFLRSTSKYK